MLSQATEIRVKDYFNQIVNEIKNLNPAQQGRVVFNFDHKNTITIGDTSLDWLSTPTLTTGFIDGSWITDETLNAELKLAERSIDSAKIKLQALTGDLIALGTITETLIGDNEISTGKIKANAITSAKIGTGEISSIHLVTDSAVITGSAQIQDAIIIEAKIGALAVTSAKIGNLAVTNAKINDMSVAKLTTGSITSKEITTTGTGRIRSSNYSSGTAGYSIDSSGYAEFNSVTVRGSIYVTGGDAFSKTSDTLDGITDGSTYKRTTVNEKTGAGRGYSALNSNNRYVQWLLASELTSGTNPTTGIIIDSGGIRGYASSTLTFEIDASDGSAFFKGDLGASTITSTGYIQASSGTELIKMYIDTVPKLYFEYDSSSVGYLYGNNYSGTVGTTTFDIDAIKCSGTFIVGVDLIVLDDLIVGDDVLIGGNFNADGTIGANNIGLMRLPVGSNKYI